MEGRLVLETARLSMREFTPDDAPHVYALNSDPEVIRYTGDEAFQDETEARRFLERYDHYKKFGVGRWLLQEKHDKTFLGFCGLKYSADLDEYDVGFRLHKRFWNHGYATEAAKACVEYGLGALKLEMIVGRAMKLNLASIRVLTKIGLTYWKEDACGQADGVVYRILKTPAQSEENLC